MEKLPNIKLLKIFLILISFTLQIALSENLFQSYYNQLSTNINQLVNLYKKEAEIESKIQQINKDIDLLTKEDNLSWLDQRKLVKLTEQKANLNTELTSVYDRIIDLNTKSIPIFSEYNSSLVAEINSVISDLDSINDPSLRKEYISYLIELKYRRDWLAESQKYLSLKKVEVDAESDKMSTLFDDLRKNELIKEDLKCILEGKISQINQLIEAAKEEKMLRETLEQFNTEMAALSGEISIISGSNLSKGSDISSFDSESPTGNAPLSADYDNYANYSNNISLFQSEIFSPYSKSDLLLLMQNIPTASLTSYITNLDSLREDYKKMIDELQTIN